MSLLSDQKRFYESGPDRVTTDAGEVRGFLDIVERDREEGRHKKRREAYVFFCSADHRGKFEKSDSVQIEEKMQKVRNVGRDTMGGLRIEFYEH